jgi:DNA ligase (NAD+)
MPIANRTDYLAAVERATRAADTYYRGDSVTMDDASYDTLLRDIRHYEHTTGTEPEHTLYNVAAGAPSGDIVHSERMYSLDNAMGDTELAEWHTRLTALIGNNPDLCVEPKLDGLAVCARYTNGTLTQVVTRGDGNAGEDVTRQARRATGLPHHLPDQVTIEIRGEIFMTDTDFDNANLIREHEHKPLFVNPRNGAAGALRTTTGSYPLSYAAYSATRPTINQFGGTHTATMNKLATFGITTAQTLLARHNINTAPTTDINHIIATIAHIAAVRPTLGYTIDGAVIKTDNAELCDLAGNAAHAPRWAVAYKYPAEERRTTLVAITLQIGRTGIITPVAELEPVHVGGATITRATLSNPLEVQRKDLRIGDTVWVRRAGEVIPEIVAADIAARPAGSEPWPLPTSCPRCCGPLDTEMKRWKCVSPGCGQREALQHFVSRHGLDIEGFGEHVVARCVETGLIAGPADIFTLTVDQLAALDRIGVVSAAKLVDRIQQARRRELAHVIYAIGLPYTGRRLSTTLAEQYENLTALRAANVDQLAALDGIGSIRAAAIVGELAAMTDTLDTLDQYGIGQHNPAYTSRTIRDTRNGNGPLAGRTAVVTGTIPGMSRDEAEQHATTLGAVIVSAMSNKVNLVICGAKAGSKRAKAEQNNIDILEADTFLDLIAHHT